MGLLFAASDAETVVEASLRGDRLFVAGLGYRVTGFLISDKPRFFTADSEEINRARFERDAVDLALRTSLERWGFLEAGVRFGRVKTVPRAGIDLPEASDQVGSLFGSFVVDTLDSLAWPEHGRRLAISGDWSLSGLGADLPFWRAQATGRAARVLTGPLVLQLDALAGFGSDDTPVYDWYRIGGTTLIPGYHHEELKGTQALAGAVSLRCKVFGQLRLLARAGTGNVFPTSDDITFDGLRWGVGLGAYHPSPIGAVAVEVGVRDDGGTLATLSVGWN